jgi:nitroimidazol reductase NimA-like FMN-containing flavoprotein (pyridoxamine 5'-phosphate oxidase superfamily)
MFNNWLAKLGGKVKNVKEYHVRLKEKEIMDQVLLKRILQTTQYVTIAMSRDDIPYLVSLSHGYDEAQHYLYFHCAKEGKKLEYLSSNNIV